MDTPTECPVCLRDNTFKLKTEDATHKYWECSHCGHIEIIRQIDAPFYDDEELYKLDKQTPDTSEG